MSRTWHHVRVKLSRFRVRCMECGKRFYTTAMCPQCPACCGVDVEPD